MHEVLVLVEEFVRLTLGEGKAPRYGRGTLGSQGLPWTGREYQDQGVRTKGSDTSLKAGKASAVCS